MGLAAESLRRSVQRALDARRIGSERASALQTGAPYVRMDSAGTRRAVPAFLHYVKPSEVRRSWRAIEEQRATRSPRSPTSCAHR